MCVCQLSLPTRGLEGVGRLALPIVFSATFRHLNLFLAPCSCSVSIWKHADEISTPFMRIHLKCKPRCTSCTEGETSQLFAYCCELAPCWAVKVRPSAHRCKPAVKGVQEELLWGKHSICRGFAHSERGKLSISPLRAVPPVQGWGGVPALVREPGCTQTLQLQLGGSAALCLCPPPKRG